MVGGKEMGIRKGEPVVVSLFVQADRTVGGYMRRIVGKYC